MIPEIKRFTKDNPCTKIDIWNCFYGKRGFIKVSVVEARSKIGVNAPRVMEGNAYLVRKNAATMDYYELTELGKEWLVNGVKRYLKNHPSSAYLINYKPT